MIGKKYIRSQFNHYVYFRMFSYWSYIYLHLFFDDMLVACKNMVENDRLKT
jgi:hypothetical protein